MALRVMALCVALSAVVGIQAQALKPVRIAFAGSTGLTEPFIEHMKDAGLEAGLSIEVVPKAESGLLPRDFSVRTRAGLPVAFAPSEGRNYFLVAVTQIGGLANVVVALDRDGEVVASVARSGRFSASGARDTSARELARKLAELVH